MYCTKCGKEIPSQTKQCAFCHTTIEPQLQPEPELVHASERYNIISKVAQGGMGEVYKAQDLRLNRIVALKRLNPAIQKNYVAIQRFMREATAIANLNHPNIVQIYDFGKDDKGYYISMEFIEGKTLKEKLVQNGSTNLETALDIIVSTAEALKFAHAKGIIHRDIKPSNIFLTKDGSVKIMDFGLVRTKGQKKEVITGSTVLIGTPAYSSPEQKKDTHHLDQRTDIYSLGLVFCELLLGKLPRLIPVDRLPSVVCRIIYKALEEDITRRYRTIDEMITDLKEVKRNLEFLPRMIKQKPRKNIKLLVVSLAILILITTLGTAAWKLYLQDIYFKLSYPSTVAPLKLNGIIFRGADSKANVAVINQRYLKVTEEIDGYTVLKIGKDEVILRKNGKKYFLSYKEPHIKKRGQFSD